MSFAIHIACRRSGLTRAQLREHIKHEIDFCDNHEPRFEPGAGSLKLDDELWDKHDVNYAGDKLIQFWRADVCWSAGPRGRRDAQAARYAPAPLSGDVRVVRGRPVPPPPFHVPVADELQSWCQRFRPACVSNDPLPAATRRGVMGWAGLRADDRTSRSPAPRRRRASSPQTRGARGSRRRMRGRRDRGRRRTCGTAWRRARTSRRRG